MINRRSARSLAGELAVVAVQDIPGDITLRASARLQSLYPRVWINYEEPSIIAFREQERVACIERERERE